MALKPGVGAGLVDGTTTHLDLSVGPTPVIMTLVVAADPVTKRSSIYLEWKRYVKVSLMFSVFLVIHSHTYNKINNLINPTYWAC